MIYISVFRRFSPSSLFLHFFFQFDRFRNFANFCRACVCHVFQLYFTLVIQGDVDAVYLQLRIECAQFCIFFSRNYLSLRLLFTFVQKKNKKNMQNYLQQSKQTAHYCYDFLHCLRNNENEMQKQINENEETDE